MTFKRFLMIIFRFGLMKRLRRGTRVTIFPSYKCSHNCSYCSLRVNGIFPVNPTTLPLESWKKFLEDYDLSQKDAGGLREVILTGGEPTLLPYFVELVEWLLFEKKWYVTIFSNLSNLEFLKVKSSLKLRIGATYHHGQIKKEKFINNYKMVNYRHRVDVEEIGYGELSFSKVKPFLTENDIENLVASIRVSPDQTMHLTCRSACTKFCDL